MSQCGADTNANATYLSLIGDEDFSITIPDLSGPEYSVPPLTGDIYQPINKITNADLTTKQIGGTGTFDILMDAFKVHLKEEYEKNRITGAEYTKAYIALVEAAMSNANQFLLQRDQAYWQAMNARFAAQAAEAAVVSARVDLNTSKVRLKTVLFEAHNQAASYAVNKMRLATEDIAYCSAKYMLDNNLPLQKDLLKEQIDSQRAQTSNTRIDGTPIAGTLGKQRELYDQQIVSYKRDAEVKTAKLFTDAWITMKTIDEGLLPPSGFQNTSLDQILSKLKVNNLLT